MNIHNKKSSPFPLLPHATNVCFYYNLINLECLLVNNKNLHCDILTLWQVNNVTMFTMWFTSEKIPNFFLIIQKTNQMPYFQTTKMFWRFSLNIFCSLSISLHGHTHNQGTSFWTQDLRNLFLLSSQYRI